MTRKAKPSALTAAILETADDMQRVGVLDPAAHEKITLRHVGNHAHSPNPATEPLRPEEIRALREEARMSQAVFARALNLTTGYISQLERGARQPTGAALALLNVVRRKGIEILC